MKEPELGAFLLLLAITVVAKPAWTQESLVSRDSNAAASALAFSNVPLIAVPNINGALADLSRIAQLRGASGDGSLLRTPSSMMSAMSARSPLLRWTRTRWAFLTPAVQYVQNSAVPFSINDGALWAGKGSSIALTGGLRVDANRLQVILAPQINFEANRSLPFYDNMHSGLPYTLPQYRSVYSTLWNIFPNGADIPFRFGHRSRAYGDPGQSSASIRLGGVKVGVSTENEWWGPGIQNALMLSNNAAGVPRVFARSARPLLTPIGTIEFSTFLGRLEESNYFRSTVAENGVHVTDSAAYVNVGTRSRLLASGALVWRPKWESNLALGVARSVFEERVYRGPLALRWFDLFRDVGHPNDLPVTDSTFRLGRDQLLSLFGRWVMPNDGFEVYVEWLRASIPLSLRDFLTDPSHSRGYTFGLQWLAPANEWAGALRLQAELTNLEQDASFRYRPIGSIYTSRAVPQGYTQRGQPLGAAIGPGSSSQFVATDYIAQTWSLGIFGERIRWNEDAHGLTPYPSFKGWCENDVSLIGGLRGRWLGTLGAINSSISTSRRYNVFFQMFAACPFNPGDPGHVVDVHNLSLTLSFEPLVRRLW